MRKILKIILSCFCLVSVGGCVYICLYEIYNSYFSEEPKNIVTYHNATQSNADSNFQNIDKTEIGDSFDNSRFSTGNVIDYTGIQDADIIEGDKITDLYQYSKKYVVLITDSGYHTANGVIIRIDNDYIYFVSCCSALNSGKTYSITFADGTVCKAENYRHDSVRDFVIVRAKVSEIAPKTLNQADDIRAGNLLNKVDTTGITGAENAVGTPDTADPENNTSSAGLTAGTSVIALGAGYQNSLNVSAGYVKSPLKTISYGNTDISFYEVSFSDLCDITGAAVITANGDVVGIYTTSGTVIPIEDIYSLMK